MGPTWGLSAPDGPHVGPMNLAIRGTLISVTPFPRSNWTDITTELFYDMYSMCVIYNMSLSAYWSYSSCMDIDVSSASDEDVSTDSQWTHAIYTWHVLIVAMKLDQSKHSNRTLGATSAPRQRRPPLKNLGAGYARVDLWSSLSQQQFVNDLSTGNLQTEMRVFAAPHDKGM